MHQGWSNGPGGTLYVCRLDPWGHLVKINLAIWGRIRRSLTTVRRRVNEPFLLMAMIAKFQRGSMCNVYARDLTSSSPPDEKGNPPGVC